MFSSGYWSKLLMIVGYELTKIISLKYSCLPSFWQSYADNCPFSCQTTAEYSGTLRDSGMWTWLAWWDQDQQCMKAVAWLFLFPSQRDAVNLRHWSSGRSYLSAKNLNLKAEPVHYWVKSWLTYRPVHGLFTPHVISDNASSPPSWKGLSLEDMFCHFNQCI